MNVKVKISKTCDMKFQKIFEEFRLVLSRVGHGNLPQLFNKENVDRYNINLGPASIINQIRI